MQCCVGTLNLDWNAEFRNLDSVLLVRLNRAGGHFLTGTIIIKGLGERRRLADTTSRSTTGASTARPWMVTATTPPAISVNINIDGEIASAPFLS
jgi:hypothetical protein